MNTHDIELPPNPITPMLAALIDKASGAGTAETVWQLMQEFANQAIEADRKRRGELVGYINPAHIGQGHGSGIFWTKDQSFNKPVYEAPQPAEPSSIRALIASDPYALTFQSIGQYRTALLRAIDEMQPAEPVKCDGNHGGPRCADPECWNDSPAEQVKVRPETLSEHIARDMREGRFPGKSERKMVPAEPVKHPSYGPDCCQGHKAESDCKCAAYDAEPAKVPSDGEIESLAKEHMFAHAQFVGAGEVWYEGEVEFARDLLAKYGQGQTRMDTGFEGENTTVSGQGSGHAKPIATVITHNNHKLLSFDPGALDELPEGAILYAKK